MARKFFALEKGIRMYAENSTTSYVDMLFGAGAPGGDTGDQDDAPVGSFYLRTSGEAYIKIADNNVAADWDKVGNVSLDELHWRNEKVVALTNDTVTSGSNIDPSAWSDNDDGFTPVVGQYIIGDANGVPALFEITVVTSPTDIDLAAASIPIANNDTFVVQNYLPDPTGQENQAIFHIPVAGSAGVKIADIDWSFAYAISLSGSYVGTTNGTPSSGDSVEVAIGYLDANQRDLISLTGEAQGAVNFTAFSAPATVLIDGTTATIKSAFQRIFDLMAQLRGVQVTGITTSTLVDSVVVDDVKAVKWLVQAFEEATPANIEAFEIYAAHNGTASADAALVDDTLYSKLKFGGGAGLTVSIDLNGTGAAQVMRLMVASSTAGVTVTARRIEVVKNVL